MENYYKYSPNAVVFKKFFGDIHLTVVLELPSNLKKTGRKDAVSVLKDEIHNLLNDTELEKMLNPKKKIISVFLKQRIIENCQMNTGE